MKPIHFATLTLLGAIWGASFLFIHITVAELGPFSLMFIRVLVAGLILAGLAYLMSRQRQPQATLQWRKNWRKYLVVGLLNSALPFSLIAFAELKITVSLAAILNSTTPLFTAIVAALWSKEQLTGRKVWGAVLGVIGVSVLVGGSPLEIDQGVIMAVVASLLAALCYGSGTVYAAKNIGGLPPLYASMAQLLGAAAILALPAALTAPSALPSATALVALAALTVLSTSCAYLLYFFLLRNVGPTRTASVTFLVPVFGSIWGALFLQEPLSSGMLLGMAIIFTSVGLVTGVRIDTRGVRRWPLKSLTKIRT